MNEFKIPLIDQRYRLLRELDWRGGYRNFEAVDICSQQLVFVQLKEPTQEDAYCKHVLNTSLMLSKLKSPSTLRLQRCGYHIEEEQIIAYMVMEHVEGMTLSSYINERGVLSVETCLRVARQILNSLEEVHRFGFLHCNLKTRNILLFQTAQNPSILSCKLFGFGTSRPSGWDIDDQDYTHCTPAFAAPEQLIDSTRIGIYSDLYALGMVLLHCLGCDPWCGKKRIDLLAVMIAGKELVLPRQIKDGPLAFLLEGLLRKNINDSKKPRRFQNCAEVFSVLDDLENQAQGI